MLPPPLPEGDAALKRRRWRKVALVISGVVWLLGLIGLVISLLQYPRGEVSWFFGLVLLSFVGPLFLIGQGIALVVALIARSTVEDEDPQFARTAVRVPAVSLALGVVGLILLGVAWHAWFH